MQPSIEEADPTGELRSRMAAFEESLGLGRPNVMEVLFALAASLTESEGQVVEIEEPLRHVALVIGLLLRASWAIGPLPITHA